MKIPQLYWGIIMIKKLMKEYITNNKYDILLISILIAIGITVGIMVYIFLNNEIKELVLVNAKKVFDISKEDTYISANIILNGLKSNIILITILLIFSVTLFGKWAIYLILISKGIAIGIYTGVLFNIFGFWWGIIVFILLVVVVNMLYIPALIYLTAMLLGLNFDIFKSRRDCINILNISKVLIVTLTSFFIIFSSIVVEQVASNIVLNIYTKL